MAVPPVIRFNVAAPLPLPITKSVLLLTTEFLTVSVPLFKTNWLTVFTEKLVAVRLPPFTTSDPLPTVTLPRLLPVPVNVNAPLPTLVKVPAPLIAPAKVVLALLNPIWSVFVLTLTWPLPVNASIVPLVAKLTVPPLTETATTFVSTPIFAQLN